MLRRLISLTLLSAAAALGTGTALSSEDRPDILIADFEGADYGGWASTGDAFGPGPARGTLDGQMPVGGFAGSGLVNTFFRGDDSTGTLTSPPFRIERSRINLLVGGGQHPGEACVNLIVGGKPVRTATGSNSEFLRPLSWDVAEFEGGEGRIEIVDRRKGGWGHVNVDQIAQSDRAPVVADDRDALLAKANASTAAAAEKVKDDPTRPTYHVLAPGNWVNDPNGPVYYKGFYHLFYQHNPYGDEWGNMHWGHVRSKDLAHWEHLPIALWPSKPLGEDHVFSGAAAIGPDGRPLIFYTSIGGRLPEQWAAVPEDDDLIRWKKHPANPILTETLHGDTKVHEWRDPFLFKSGGRTYMVLGGNLNASQGGEGVVCVYRAEDEELTKWTYLGVLFKHPDTAVKNVECPLFFPLDGKWVLIVSQGQPVDWFVGDLDESTMRFTPTSRGKLDYGQLYAPNVLMNDPKGRKILWGWVNGVPGGKGWRHCLSLPRVLSIGKDGRLRQQPVGELEELASGSSSTGLVPGVEGKPAVLPDVRGDAIRLAVELDLGQAKSVGLDILRSDDGRRSVPIRFDGRTLDVAGTKAPVEVRPGEPLRLAIFVDHSIVEVVDGDMLPKLHNEASWSTWITRVVDYRPGDVGVAAVAEGGRAGSVAVMDARPIGSIWVGPKGGR